MSADSAHTFTLTVTLGNDAMSTFADVARMLRAVASRIEDPDAPVEGDGDAIMDINGNKVGRWKTE
jgi:hypothetical protein